MPAAHGRQKCQLTFAECLCRTKLFPVEHGGFYQKGFPSDFHKNTELACGKKKNKNICTSTTFKALRESLFTEIGLFMCLSIYALLLGLRPLASLGSRCWGVSREQDTRGWSPAPSRLAFGGERGQRTVSKSTKKRNNFGCGQVPCG